MAFPKFIENFYITAYQPSQIRFSELVYRLSKFVSAYRKSYSSNHVLSKLIEEWKKSMEVVGVTGIGVAFMNLFYSQ